MGPVQTLHEFALNLLSDPQALADFNANPEGVLNAAGLGDVSAADVHDIMPLVMDTAVASVTETPSSLAATGDVAETLDQTATTVTAGDVLAGLPDLSGVFGTVSEVAEETGLNTVTHEVLGTVSNVVGDVASAVHNVPVAGPVLEAGAIDLQNTVAAVGDHLFDGQLVGSAVDALTNHAGDALLPGAVVDTVSQLPVVGEPVGGLLNDVRYEAGSVLGTVNQAIGSTPVGVPSGQALAATYTGVTNAVNNVVGSVADHVADVPVVGGVASGVVNTVGGVLGGATGALGAAGDLSGTLDHAVSTVAATAATPALPAIPALPAVPGVDGAVNTVTSTVGDVAANAPVVSNVVASTASDFSVTHVYEDATSHVTDTHAVTSVVGDLTGSVTGLNIDSHATSVDAHATGGLLGNDGIHLLH